MIRLFIAILVFLSVDICNAEVVVRLSMQQGTTKNTVDLKLLDGDAPLTVANFLNYADNGDYDNSFIHRSVPGFIMQVGGFTYNPLDGAFINDPALNDFPGGLQPVPAGPAVVNEFRGSNLSGTIAMAKLPSDPDSATNEWFFNLADNSTNLDNQNGGFTVFGEVLNNGMAVIDALAIEPVYDRSGDIHTTFDTLPLKNFTSNPVQAGNLLLLKSVKQLFSITPDLEFGLVAPGATSQSEVIIKNTGNEILQSGNISAVSPVSAPFIIVNSTCSNQILNPGETCNIVVLFAPVTKGSAYSGSFKVTFPGLGLDYEVALSGKGGTSLDDFFTVTPGIDFGVVTTGSNVQPEVIIENTGNDSLQIGLIGNNDPLSAPFVAVDSICRNRLLLPGEKCAVIVLFTPTVPGVYADSFNIELPDFSINHLVSLDGEGGPAVDEPDILVSFSSVLFGTISVIEPGAQPFTSQQFIQNLGNLPMDLSISLQGPSQDEITLSGNCLEIISLAAGAGSTCFLNIHVAPLTPGVKSVTVVIDTNDPDENPFLMLVEGVAVDGTLLVDDDDAIPGSIEDAGLNGGDGNNDDVLDSKQDQVVSLQDLNGTYVTFVSINSVRFSRMLVFEPSIVGTVDEALRLDSGAFNYVIEGVPVGGQLDVGIIYPGNWIPKAYYLYGATPDNTDPRWYEFEFDGNTGASLFNNATMTSTDGSSSIVRNLLTLRLEDGGRGDADLTADGKITVLGATSLSKAGGGDSGLTSPVTLLTLALLALLLRNPGIRLNLR